MYDDLNIDKYLSTFLGGYSCLNYKQWHWKQSLYKKKLAIETSKPINILILDFICCK